MASTEKKRELPPWVAAVAIVAVLIGIAYYGFHVVRGQAPNSDFKQPTSFHGGGPTSAQTPAAPATR